MGIRKTNESEPLTTCRYANQVTSKPGLLFGTGMSLAGGPISGQVVSGMKAA